MLQSSYTRKGFNLHRILFFLASFVLFSSSSVWADISLIGANPAASKDGLVPAWQGGIKQHERTNGHHTNVYEKDSPIFIIDSTNYRPHKDRLSSGLIAMLERYPETFRIPVYPSHRSASYPDWFYDAMRKGNSKTQLTENGNAIVNPIAGVMFPQPKNGLEAIWNHLTRWRGRFASRHTSEAIVYPDGNRRFYKTEQQVSFELFRSDPEPFNEKSVLYYYYSAINEPANLAGGALLIVDYLNQQQYPRQTWSYDAGQRRVKRLPYVMHDNAALMAESLRTADDTDMFNGSPERYNWKLEGKQVMYIPYNSYLMTSPNISYDQILTKHHPNPDYTRYEAHRVWKVVATLKTGEYHIYSKRVFYLDEDSWSIAIVDNFDQKGEIWRVSLAHLKNFYEVPMIFTGVDAFHDLKSARYNIVGLTNEEKSSGEFTEESPNKSYFTPGAMRARVGR